MMCLPALAGVEEAHLPDLTACAEHAAYTPFRSWLAPLAEVRRGHGHTSLPPPLGLTVLVYTPYGMEF